MKKLGVHGLALASMACCWPGFAGADSACWPERELLGRRADGWVWGGTQAVAGPLHFYTAQGAPVSGTPTAAPDCHSLGFLRGPCDSEYALLPIERSTRVGGLVRGELADGAEVWLKPEELGPVTELMPVVPATPEGEAQRWGLLRPHDAALRQSPALGAAALAIKDLKVTTRRVLQQFVRAHSPAGQSQAAQDAALAAALQASEGVPGEFVRVLKAEAAVTNAQGHWLRVSEWLVYTPDGGLTQVNGPLLRSGYLLHRDRRGVVKAVIESLWCD